MKAIHITEILVGEEKKIIEYISHFALENVEGFEKHLEKHPVSGKTLIQFLEESSTKINVFILQTTKKSSIGVEEVSELQQFAIKKPNLAEISLAVIYNAEKLSLPAQNKLLKLLEEPPYYLKIYLTTNRPGQLLQTIRSRAILSSLSKNSVLINISSEIKEIVKKVISLNNKNSNSHEPKEIYQDLTKLIGKYKVAAEQRTCLYQLVQAITEEYEEINLQELNPKDRKIIDSVNYLYKGLENNANIKLLIDKFFLDLNSMV